MNILKKHVARFCRASALGLFAVALSAMAAQAQNLKNPTDMSFGEIWFTYGGTGSVRLATNGDVSYLGSYSGGGLGTAGSIEVGGKKTTVLITCDSTGTLSSGTETFTLQNIEVWQTPGTSWGNGYTCQGIDSATPYAMTITGVNDNTFMIGGELDLSVAPTDGGAVNTSNTGGQMVTFRIVYQ